MKIGIIENGLPPHSIGGAEIQAWKLACHLSVSLNHEVTIFVHRYGLARKRENYKFVSI